MGVGFVVLGCYGGIYIVYIGVWLNLSIMGIYWN